MSKLRLDKYLADMKAGTRSEVKQLIRKGRVKVNGQTALAPERKIDTQLDVVELDQAIVGYVETEYWMLNKPQGVVSATEDRREQTVLSLLPTAARKDLFPVGRLDKDTEGLLLLTNDGALAHALLAPKRHVDKVYYARVRGQMGEQEQRAFAEGMDIGDEQKTLPAVLRVLRAAPEESEVEVTLREGRFHQIKRMFEAVGSEVLYLKRLSMGTLCLDGTLRPGEARRLTEEEIAGLKRI